VTAADLAVDDWPAEVLAEITRTHSRGLYLLVRDSGVPVRHIVLSSDQALSADDLVVAAGPRPVRDSPDASRVETSKRLGLTVVICTLGRPEGLPRCLEALSRQTDPDFEVLVVDNSIGDNSQDSSASVLAAVEASREQLRVRLIRQPVPGLSNARNAALSHLQTELVAWIDDDEEADRSWVASLKAGFGADASVSCVVGDMLPARLATTTDLLFEQFGGHNKRTHLVSERYTKAALGPRVFYPLPSFGTGGNMAMRTAIFDVLPPFDADLGAGTRCRAGEDTLMFSEILDAGQVIAYEPSVVTWHHHRASVAELSEQLDGYGRGLGGYYAALVIRRPRRLVPLLILAPRAVIDLASPHSARNRGSSPELAQVRQGNRWAIVRGAWTYLRLRVARRRMV
jgi:glycosyltransferase involved in cell wall biosynthesis